MSVMIVEGPWLETQRRTLDSSTPVGRLMTASPEAAGLLDIELARVPSIHVLATVREAAHLMASLNVLQVLVENTRGEIVGVLTASDLYRWVTDDPSHGPDAGQA